MTTTVQTASSRKVTAFVWALALLVAAQLTRSAVRHHMPVLDTATVFLFALYGSRGSVQHLVNVFQSRRKRR